MDQVQEKKETPTLTDLLRVRFRGILNPIAAFLNKLGIHPNTLTLIGLAGNFVASILLANGHLTAGGIVILIMGPIDALDGSMARLRGLDGKFGAFVDSVTDRYSELVIFCGLLVHFVQNGEKLASILVFVAASGSVLVSYVRARGQSLGWDTKIGILTRIERFLVLCPALIFNIPIIGLWIIAILANFTALQRIIDVRRQAYQTES